jgi:hypothetical protein
MIHRLLGFREGDELRLSPMLAPYIIGACSILALAVENIDTGIQLRQMVFPLVLSLLCVHVFWLISRYLTGDPHRRSVITLTLTILLLYFGYLETGLHALDRALPLVGVPLLGAVATATLFLLLVGLLRFAGDITPVARFLRVTALVLLPLFGVQIAFPLLSSGAVNLEEDRVEESLPAGARGADGNTDPDIFLIILDSYTGPASLREVYGLDISDFIDELESMGFVVPRASRANYVTSVFSISSMLEWTYIHEELVRQETDRQALGIGFRRLHENATTRFLRQRGYESIFFRSSYPPLNHSPAADIHIPGHLPADLEVLWFNSTVLPAMMSAFCGVFSCRWGLGFTPEPVEAYQERMARIASIPPGDRPRFVFAHILLPHEPFIFDEHCRSTAFFTPSSVTSENEEEVRAAYRNQVRCLNVMVQELAERLVRVREVPPVVIIQSDHGFGRLGQGWGVSLEEADVDRMEERFDIFAAYYMPGDGLQGLPDTITPINAFRTIFREQFQLDLPPLPDSSFWSSYRHPVRFEPSF